MGMDQVHGLGLSDGSVVGTEVKGGMGIRCMVQGVQVRVRGGGGAGV